MAGVKISALPPAASALLTDQVPAVQAGVTDRETWQQVLTLFQASATNFTGLTGKLQAPTAIADSAGLNNIAFTYTGSAVNYLTSANSATGFSPGISATGTDANINLLLTGKGTGAPVFRSPTSTTVFAGIPNSGSASFLANFITPVTANRNYTFQDASGTVAFLTDITAQTDYVNVTGTTQTVAENTKYIANNAGLVTFTIPATFGIGKWFKVIGGNAGGGWRVQQAIATHQIKLLAVSSTLGIAGTVDSTDPLDGAEFVCIVANNIFNMQEVVGNPNLL